MNAQHYVFKLGHKDIQNTSVQLIRFSSSPIEHNAKLWSRIWSSYRVHGSAFRNLSHIHVLYDTYLAGIIMNLVAFVWKFVTDEDRGNEREITCGLRKFICQLLPIYWMIIFGLVLFLCYLTFTNDCAALRMRLGVSAMRRLFWSWTILILFDLSLGLVKSSVPEPDPNPQDPKVFWASRIRVRNYLCGSGSGSRLFNQPAKNQEKPCFLQFFKLLNDLFSLKADVNVPSVISKEKKEIFFVASWTPLKKRAGSVSVPKHQGSGTL